MPRMRTLSAILLAVALAACGHDQQPTSTTTPDPEPAAAGPSCADATANARAKLSAEAGGDPAGDRYDRLEAALYRSCSEDGWSAEVIACIATAADHPALHECSHGMPKEVYEPLAAEIGEIMEAPAAETTSDGD
jgi:hypothetical protein